MGLTAQGRNHRTDALTAFTHILGHPGADVMDVAGALGSGARTAREVATLLLGMLAIEGDDATGGYRACAGLTVEDVAAAWDARVAAAANEAAAKGEDLGDATRVGNMRKCRCGCGAYTNHPTSTYLPGHDARHAGNVARAIVADPTARISQLQTLPTERLREKASALVERWVAKAAAKDATPARTFVPGSVKVGRWTYPARSWSDGTTERNTKRDGSGEWVPVA